MSPWSLDIAKEVTVLPSGEAACSRAPPAELRQNEEVASAFLGIDVEAGIMTTPRREALS